jgi:diguanylate cyclase (GGDEF)-like protein
MRLSRLFMCTTGLLLTLVVVMLGRTTMQDFKTLGAADQGLAAMELAYRVMKFAEKASAERGPSIPILNEVGARDPSKRERLTKARLATDEALALALAGLKQGLQGASSEPSRLALMQIQKARDQLLLARQELERIAALPFSERIAPELRLTRIPIDQMFGVIDTVLEGVAGLSTEAEQIYPDLSLHLVGARYAAELREYAGRLGSQFTVPLATQKPLGVEERRDIPQLIGRIQQLKKLVEVRARVTSHDLRLDAAMSEMNKRYFGVGLPLIDRLVDAGNSAGNSAGVSGNLEKANYGIDSARFVALYVPEMKSIVDLRDAMFLVATEKAKVKITQAKYRMALNAAIGVAILAVEITVFVLIRRRVLKPLLVTTGNMLRLMGGDRNVVAERSDRKDEIGDMQNAVAALKDADEKRLALETERDHLIEHLQIASEVDFLTSLLNRRALMQRGEQLLAQAKRHNWSVAVVLFDIDHFKVVNDAYGHAVGDQVLIQVAAIAKGECRQADLLARYGGEEFVLLAFDCDVDQAIHIAERVRSKMEATKFSAGDSDGFDITASFGVAHAQSFEVDTLELLIKAADAALYKAKSQGRNQVVESDMLFVANNAA